MVVTGAWDMDVNAFARADNVLARLEVEATGGISSA
jgi:hypothetical protein